MECTTATILKCIEDHGWELPPCPRLQWLDKLGHDVVVRLQSKSGPSAFHIRYDPGVEEFTYFRTLDPLVMFQKLRLEGHSEL